MAAKKKKRAMKKKKVKPAKKRKAAPKRKKAKAVKKKKSTAKKKVTRATAKAVKKKTPARKATIAKKTVQATAEKILGKVTHYYDRIGVAIIELKEPIRLGEIVRIKHGQNEYMQPVTSLQIDHVAVNQAKKKDVVGLKVMEKVQEGSVVLPL